MTSEDEAGPGAQSDQDDDDPDGQYAFRRTAGCTYQAPLPDHCGDWSWSSPDDGGAGDPRFRFELSALTQPDSHFIGYVRRRIGRGGRSVSLTAASCASVHNVIHLHDSGSSSTGLSVQWMTCHPVKVNHLKANLFLWMRMCQSIRFSLNWTRRGIRFLSSKSHFQT